MRMAKLKISSEQDDEQKVDVDFNELFRGYFKPLCAFCQYKFNLDINEAKDAVHTGFINLLEAGFVYTSKLSAGAYLYKIVGNICFDQIRHEKVKRLHAQHLQKNSEGSGFEKEYSIPELKELQNNINKAIAEMPDQMREVFLLSRDFKLKNAEIALKKGISIKTVETQMSRALAKLKLHLAAYLTVFWIFLLIYLHTKKYFIWL